MGEILKFLIAFIFITTMQIYTNFAFAEVPEIELICKLDTGVSARYSINFSRKVLIIPGMSVEVPIDISDKEILHKQSHNGVLLSLIKIDRYSLKSTQYDGLRLSGKEWVSGQCEKLEKKF